MIFFCKIEYFQYMRIVFFLGNRAYQDAMNNPSRYVVKPQREGTYNNF